LTLNGSPITDLGDDAWQLDLFFSVFYGGSSWVIRKNYEFDILINLLEKEIE